MTSSFDGRHGVAQGLLKRQAQKLPNGTQVKGDL